MLDSPNASIVINSFLAKTKEFCAEAEGWALEADGDGAAAATNGANGHA